MTVYKTHHQFTNRNLGSHGNSFWLLVKISCVRTLIDLIVFINLLMFSCRLISSCRKPLDIFVWSLERVALLFDPQNMTKMASSGWFYCVAESIIGFQRRLALWWWSQREISSHTSCFPRLHMGAINSHPNLVSWGIDCLSHSLDWCVSRIFIAWLLSSYSDFNI